MPEDTPQTPDPGIRDEGTAPFAAPLGANASRRDRRRARRAGRSPWRRRITIGGISLVLLVVLLLGGSAFYLESKLHEIGRLPGIKVKPVSSSGADDILLVGSTDRCSIKPAKNFEAWVRECAEGVTGDNSDVIMILRLVPGRVPTLLSIPRDTFVPDARQGDLSNRVDAALANGPNQLIQAIEEDFGIPINHFVVLNFETFTNVVDVLGGITMDFPTTLRDYQSGLEIDHSGCQHISGAEALALVRARHVYYHYDRKTHKYLGYDGSGDIGRIERDHVFLRVLAEKVAARGVGNPLTDASLLSSIAPNLTVDSSFGTSTMLHMILDYHAKAGGTPELTLPIVEDPYTYYYKGYSYGDVVFPTEPQDQAAIDRFMGGRPIGATVKPSTVSVSVVDANNSPAEVGAIESNLRAVGFAVSNGGSADPVSKISETMVYYSSAKRLVDAERVLRSLSGAVVLAKGPTTGGADVTVVAGSDVSVTVPGASTAAEVGTAAGAAGSPILATLLAAVVSNPTTAGAGALAPPTTAETTTIPPFDPRACSAH